MKKTTPLVPLVVSLLLVGCGHAASPDALSRAGDDSAVAQAIDPGYHTVESLTSDLLALATAHPDVCHLHVIGQSIEGRPIQAVELAGHPGQGPACLFSAGLHAQQLAPVELAYRLAGDLAEGYDRDPATRALLDAHDVWIVPCANPDGRAHFLAGDRFWWRNARDNGDGTVGVDLDHNFDDHWAGAPGDPGYPELEYDVTTSENYHGTAAFSEPESRALRDLCLAERFTLSVDLQNDEGRIYWPPGYDPTATTPDEATFEAIGRRLGNAVGYRTGTLATSVAVTYGDFMTWQYDKLGTIAFGVSLADPGFAPPIAQVDQDWQAWGAELRWLVQISGKPRDLAATPPRT